MNIYHVTGFISSFVLKMKNTDCSAYSGAKFPASFFRVFAGLGGMPGLMLKWALVVKTKKMT